MAILALLRPKILNHSHYQLARYRPVVLEQLFKTLTIWPYNTSIMHLLAKKLHVQ